jgi:acyl phosphate:glycerol-3-phosphate acyltransferase
MIKPMELLVASYLLGSLPIGLWIARWWAGIDVREHGSCNIGATNVYRVVGKPAGVVVFLLDVCKGLIPPIAAARIGFADAWQVAAGLAAITGHTVSPFLGFKGGKGISTSLGVLFGVAWPVAWTAWAMWGVALFLTGYVSLGSVFASVSLAPLMVWYYPHDFARLAFVIVAGVMSLYKHRGNIARLAAGSENPMRKHGAGRGVVFAVAFAEIATLAMILVFGLKRW